MILNWICDSNKQMAQLDKFERIVCCMPTELKSYECKFFEWQRAWNEIVEEKKKKHTQEPANKSNTKT